MIVSAGSWLPTMASMPSVVMGPSDELGSSTTTTSGLGLLADGDLVSQQMALYEARLNRGPTQGYNP